jgi:tetratricopeptide (TPR) repeat protein
MVSVGMASTWIQPPSPTAPLRPLPLPESWFSTGRPATVDINLARQLKAQGNWYSDHGDYAQAISFYNQALQANPQYSDAWFNLATLYRGQKAWPEAIKAYVQVVRLNPSDVEAWLRLGESYDHNRQPALALQALDRVLALQPYHDVANRKKAWLLFRLGSAALDAVKPGLSRQLLNQKQRMAFDKAHKVLHDMAKQGLVTLPGRFKQVTCHVTDFELGSPSLAEYDATTDSIRTIPELVFADANVLAAYLAHEYVHAQDKDNHTDVAEELNGYLASIQVWLSGKGLLTEPNLDYATDLSKQGLTALSQRIERVYLHDHKLLWAPLSPAWR